MKESYHFFVICRHLEVTLASHSMVATQVSSSPLKDTGSSHLKEGTQVSPSPLKVMVSSHLQEGTQDSPSHQEVQNSPLWMFLVLLWNLELGQGRGRSREERSREGKVNRGEFLVIYSVFITSSVK